MGVETSSEFALHEFVTPDSICASSTFYRQCTTTPITQVTFTQPVDESTGQIRVDRELVVRVTSMKERLRQVDPYKYQVSTGGESDDLLSPSYTVPRHTPGLLESGRLPHSIQYFKVTLKSVAYIFITVDMGIAGINYVSSYSEQQTATNDTTA